MPQSVSGGLHTQRSAARGNENRTAREIFAADLAAIVVCVYFWQTEQFDRPAYPKLHFVEERYAGDPTNWWIPNRAGAEAILRSAGFDIAAHPEEEVFICRRRAAVERYGEELPAWSKP